MSVTTSTDNEVSMLYCIELVQALAITVPVSRGGEKPGCVTPTNAGQQETGTVSTCTGNWEICNTAWLVKHSCKK